jgi:hypothetical protein
MSNAQKISISISEEMHKLGKELAVKRGVGKFSTLVSILIAEEAQRQNKKKERN